MRFITLLAAYTLVLICLPEGSAQERSKEKAIPKVTGQWSGTWGPLSKSPEAAKGPELALDCTVVQMNGTWQATFEGECGRPYKYTIKMDGRQAGDAVLFKGSADLGEKDGGVYDWIGRATADEFVGFYTSAKYTGMFRMTPKKEAAPKAAAQKEIDALQGAWITTALTYNGKDFLASGKPGFHFIFKGDEAAIEGNEAVKKEYAKIKVKLDPATAPKCMDITVSTGIQLNAAIEGIYELKGDELKICAKVFGKDRPMEFSSPDGASIAFLVLKREER